MSVDFSNFFAITKANLDKETNRKQYRRDIVKRLQIFWLDIFTPQYKHIPISIYFFIQFISN